MDQLYSKAFINVVTRCFGWGLPTTTMVPYADFINHHNVDSSYEFISKNFKPNISEDQVQEQTGMPQAYFTQTKREIHYSNFYESATTD